MFSRILPVETGGNIMSEITTVVLDAMGGDNAPDANIKGAVKAIKDVEETTEVILVGNKDIIIKKIKE